MEFLKKCVDQILYWYGIYKLIILLCIVICSFSLGFFVFGPFMTSEVYEWFKIQSNGNKIISELVDVQGMVADKLIASTIPLFMVWVVVLTAYRLDKTKISIINENSKYLALFSGTTAIIVLSLGSILSGICSYGLKLYGYSHSFLIATLFALMVIASGLLIRKATKPELVENSSLNKLSGVMLFICIIFMAAAYLWGLIKDPLMYWSVINNAYEMANTYEPLASQ